MTVTPHREFTWPEDPSVTAWRYLDLPKYLSMLESEAPFFCRLDKLHDPFEGSRPRANVEAYSAAATQFFSERMSEERAAEGVSHRPPAVLQMEDVVGEQPILLYFDRCEDAVADQLPKLGSR